MWIMAGSVAGLAWGWPALIAAIKPTLAPIALTGVRSRSWWIGAGIVVLAALPFGAMWLDYVTVIRNAQGADLPYILGEWPILLVLVAAAKHRGE